LSSRGLLASQPSSAGWSSSPPSLADKVSCTVPGSKHNV
jgi:hypothetical protein